jgi:hypothetical protein
MVRQIVFKLLCGQCPLSKLKKVCVQKAGFCFSHQVKSGGGGLTDWASLRSGPHSLWAVHRKTILLTIMRFCFCSTVRTDVRTFLLLEAPICLQASQQLRRTGSSDYRSSRLRGASSKFTPRLSVSSAMTTDAIAGFLPLNKNRTSYTKSPRSAPTQGVCYCLGNWIIFPSRRTNINT